MDKDSLINTTWGSFIEFQVLRVNIARCLKITDKVSFKIASEFWVDKSLLKMPKMVHFGEFLKNGQTVLPDKK